MDNLKSQLRQISTNLPAFINYLITPSGQIQHKVLGVYTGHLHTQLTKTLRSHRVSSGGPESLQN